MEGVSTLKSKVWNKNESRWTQIAWLVQRQGVPHKLFTFLIASPPASPEAPDHKKSWTGCVVTGNPADPPSRLAFGFCRLAGRAA